MDFGYYNGIYDIGKDIKVFRYDPADKKHKTYVLDSYNTRYNSNEPSLTYNGLKFVNETLDKNNHTIFKKGECPVFDVDAVLVKHEGDTTKLVKGVSVKSVKFKNNLNATVVEDPTNERENSLDDSGNGTAYINNYKLTLGKVDGNNGMITGVEFVGPDWKSQLTKTENANFKGQPSFTITVDAKGDAKEYASKIKKAVKGENATFNFEIRQLNIGDYEENTINVTKDFTYSSKEGSPEDLEKANAALKELYEKYVNEFAAYVLADTEDFSWIKKDEQAKDYVRRLGESKG